MFEGSVLRVRKGPSIELSFSKCDLWTSSPCDLWTFRKTNLKVPPKTCWIRALGAGTSNLCFKKRSYYVMLMHADVWVNLFVERGDNVKRVRFWYQDFGGGVLVPDKWMLAMEWWKITRQWRKRPRNGNMCWTDYTCWLIHQSIKKYPESPIGEKFMRRWQVFSINLEKLGLKWDFKKATSFSKRNFVTKF